VIEGETEDEILSKGADHAIKVHGLKAMLPKVLNHRDVEKVCDILGFGAVSQHVKGRLTATIGGQYVGKRHGRAG